MPTVSNACVHFPSARANFSGVPKNAAASRVVAARVASGFSSGFSRRGERYSFESDIVYGEDAPLTGFRQRPPAELGRQSRAVTQFPQRTTSDCYSSFPGEVKSSCPMFLAVPVPEEVAAVFAADPSTGCRHRPNVGEERMESGEAPAEDVIEDNRRWLAARRGVDFQ